MISLEKKIKQKKDELEKIKLKRKDMLSKLNILDKDINKKEVEIKQLVNEKAAMEMQEITLVLEEKGLKLSDIVTAVKENKLDKLMQTRGKYE